MVRSVGGSISSSPAPRRTRAPKVVEVELEDVVQTLDAGLDHQLVLVGPEAREVEHQRLVAPDQDVGRVGGDLVGQRLASGRRLGDLQQEARREDALMVEPVEVDGLDAGQFVDRWHARMMPRRDIGVVGFSRTTPT